MVASYTYQRALNGIKAADVFFVWIRDMEAYGTLIEIGYAKALGKHIVLGVPHMEKIDSCDPANSRGELWFAHQSADEVLHGFSAEDCFIQWAENTQRFQTVGK